MIQPKELYKSLMLIRDLREHSTEKALELMGQLIDLSLDLKQIEGLNHAARLLEELEKRQMISEQKVILYYFMGNAWANLRQLSSVGDNNIWSWEQPEVEKEIIYFRRAYKEDGFKKVPKEQQCQILTNLANLLDHIGRFVEAIEYWNRALDILPSFAMALGNRGIAYFHYADALYDEGHKAILRKFAHVDLKKARKSQIHESAKKIFEKYLLLIETILSQEYLDKDFDLYNFSLGKSKKEIHYRQWCLKNRLFLNPLNDLGTYPIAAQDVFSTPNIVVGIGEGPYYQGFFNQMKQEFVSARYLYYESINAKQPHFSDKDVLLYNTLDYPSYSLATEKMKIAFRMTYSLFDKIAYFLDHYLGLRIIPKRKINFRTLFYLSQKMEEGLRSEFQQCKNWPLRGLFWLSKDLYEYKPGFKESIEPDAQKIADIRNHLEHKYFKLHDADWHGPTKDKISRRLADTLALSMYKKEFEVKTLRLIKMVRAALIYLSLTIHSEEHQRAKVRKPGAIIPGLRLDIWEDKWKV
jgi:tetratricopeptide (TPR) repeat protein